jgi:hypothetical protein
MRAIGIIDLGVGAANGLGFNWSTQQIGQLRGVTTRKLIEADSKAADNYPSKKRAELTQANELLNIFK